jgi:hypothetical protein
MAIHAVVDNYATHKHPKVQRQTPRLVSRVSKLGPLIISLR